MQVISDIFQLFTGALTLFTWRDVIEICCLSCATYQFLLWLNQDAQKTLVFYFYGYCFALWSSHYLQLNILSQSLLMGAPIILCIFIIFHQQILQRNFLAMKKIHPVAQTNEHWIDELIRASLYAMNKSKNLIWVIERKDSAEAILNASCLFYADLKKDLVDLLLEHQEQTNTILWINQTGKLVTINAEWKTNVHQAWISPETEQLPQWQQHALLVSSKTDAIIVYSCCTTRLFTIIMQEKNIETISAHQTSLLLKRLLIHSSSFQEGIPYAPQSSQTSPQQRHT